MTDETIYAWETTDGFGTPEVVTGTIPGLGPQKLIMRGMADAMSLRPLAQAAANGRGQTVRLQAYRATGVAVAKLEPA